MKFFIPPSPIFFVCDSAGRQVGAVQPSRGGACFYRHQNIFALFLLHSQQLVVELFVFYDFKGFLVGV